MSLAWAPFQPKQKPEPPRETEPVPSIVKRLEVPLRPRSSLAARHWLPSATPPSSPARDCPASAQPSQVDQVRLLPILSFNLEKIVLILSNEEEEGPPQARCMASSATLHPTIIIVFSITTTTFVCQLQ